MTDPRAVARAGESASTTEAEAKRGAASSSIVMEGHDVGFETGAAPRNGTSSVESPKPTTGPVGNTSHPLQNRTIRHEDPAESVAMTPASSSNRLYDEATPVAVLDARSTVLPSAGPLPRPPAVFSSDDEPPIELEFDVIPSLFASSSSTTTTTAAAAAAAARSDPWRNARQRTTGRRSGSQDSWDADETGGRATAPREGSLELTSVRRLRRHIPPQFVLSMLSDDTTWSTWLVSLLVDTVMALIASRISNNSSAYSLLGSMGSRQGRPLGLLPQPSQRQSQPVAPMPLGQSVKGLANYGQTCFLNSVLQALASLPSFEMYLHQIITVKELSRHYSQTLNGEDTGFDRNTNNTGRSSSAPSDGLCQAVLDIVWSINGGCCTQIHGTMNQLSAVHGWSQPSPRPFDATRRADPRTLLSRVGAKHAQFASKSSIAMAAATREQQDAQEFWQALLGMVVEDADVSRLGPALVGGTPMLSNDLTASAATDNRLGDSEPALTLAAALRLPRQRRVDEEDDDMGEPASEDGQAYSFMSQAQTVHASPAPNGFSDEKKLEDGSSGGSNSDLELDGDEEKYRKSATNVGSTYGTVSHLPYAANALPVLGSGRRMADAISSASPSPFSGWIGSVLQCRECRHVRPIRNHLFVDLPVVPTGVSSYLHRRAHDPRLSRREPSSFSKQLSPDQSPPCTLEQCLEDYTSVERVHDVECRSCTHAREVAVLNDEVQMLEQGIRALEAKVAKKNPKSHRSMSSEDAQDLAKPLRDELLQVQTRLDALRLASPDDEGTMERILSEEPHLDACDGLEADPSKLQLKRTNALKCLMLTRLPAVLCIHVQRRFYDPLTLRASKTAQHVVFPEVLDVGPYCVYAGSSGKGPGGDRSADRSSRIPYRLMSVIEHTGGAFYGHYVSYRRDLSSPNGNQWLYISDDTVRRVDWTIVRRCQAYMLFYEAFV